ncbi:Dephospho-CoA kinase [subsurface metagenome]
MDNPVRKPIIGILGGVASGKSSVAAELAKLGCGLIDADKIAHELLDGQNVKEEVINSFGRAVLDHTGKINRRKLADIVFADGDKLSTLNRIVHPLVLARAERLIEQYNRQQQVRAIVLDMPLLVEVGWDKRCDRLIFVDCKPQIRLKRAKKMGLFDKNQLKIRENFQISLDKKAAIADNAVDNNSGFSALAKQVADIFSYIVDSR